MLTAKQVMRSEVLSVAPTDSVDRAISLLVDNQFSGLLVLDKAGRLVGIISEFDLLGLICECEDEGRTVAGYMSSDVCSVDEDTGWLTIADMFKSQHMRRLPVTRNGKVVGIITRRDLILAIRELPVCRFVKRELWFVRLLLPARQGTDFVSFCLPIVPEERLRNARNIVRCSVRAGHGARWCFDCVFGVQASPKDRDRSEQALEKSSCP